MIREFLFDFINGFRSARRQRRLIEHLRESEAALLADRPWVVKVGRISQNGPYGFTLEADWEFLLPPRWMRHGQELCGYWSDGEWRAFGYTAKELTEIHARRREFV